jgi:hypothetical protein
MALGTNSGQLCQFQEGSLTQGRAERTDMFGGSGTIFQETTLAST